MTPRTPGFSFPRSPRPEAQSHTFTDKNRKMNSERKRGDIEKGGFASLDEQIAQSSERDSNKCNHSRNPSDVNKKLPKPKPTIDVPQSHFEIDSPLKSPMWQRILGRK